MITAIVTEGFDAWRQVALILMISVAVGLFLQGFLIWIGRLLFRLGEHQIDPSTRKQIRWSGFVSGFSWSALASSGSLELRGDADRYLDLALLIANVVATGWLVAAIWEYLCDFVRHRKISEDKRTNNLVLPFAKKFGRATIFVITGVVLLGSMNVNVAGLVAGLGLGGVIVALAAKDSVENVFGSVTLLFDMPFAIGDWVTIGTVDGVVEEINLRSTRIRTFSDSLVTLPNSNLIKASVENWGQRRFRRLRSRIAIEPEAPADAVEAWLHAIRADMPNWPYLVAERSTVALFDVSDQGIIVQLTAFFEAKTLEDELNSREEVLLRILRLATEHKVPLATSFSMRQAAG